MSSGTLLCVFMLRKGSSCFKLWAREARGMQKNVWFYMALRGTEQTQFPPCFLGHICSPCCLRHTHHCRPICTDAHTEGKRKWEIWCGWTANAIFFSNCVTIYVIYFSISYVTTYRRTYVCAHKHTPWDFWSIRPLQNISVYDIAAFAFLHTCFCACFLLVTIGDSMGLQHPQYK